MRFMPLFLDYLWIWIVLTLFAGIFGYSLYQSNPRKRTLAAAVLMPILTLSLGLYLYYGVDTDRKSIKRMLDALIVAIVNDDLEEVYQFTTPKAAEVRQLAKDNMKMINILQARYHNLEIEVNDAASPPIAKVRLSAIFYWKNKQPLEGFLLNQPIPENVQFDIELIKTKSNSWLVTNKCRFLPRHFP